MKRAQRAVVVGCLLAVGLAGWQAWAQVTCTPTPNWRPPLVYFCDDSPARATEVNGNFRQVVAWLEAKVGDAGQPTSLPPQTVTSAMIADGTISSADLAGGAIVGAHLADGGVSARTLASPLATYVMDDHCPNAGLLTTASTCQYQGASCGTCSVGPANIQRFRDCNDVCWNCALGVPPPPPSCTATNALVGYLVR